MRYCNVDGCIKRPSFNYKDKKTGIYCYNHKLDNMINVNNKNRICHYENCIKTPSFNYKGEKPIYCNDHKLDNMINIYDKNCLLCEKIPSFNYKGEKPIYCSDHKLDNMINVKDPLCLYQDCLKYASYNYENKKKLLYCSEHKLDNMIDVKHKKCLSCNLFVSTKKYEHLCITCYMWKYPEKEITKKYRKKELKICEEIKEEFKELNINFNKTVGGCSKRRPDIFIELYTHTIIIEIDENQHYNYNTICESNRINELYTDLGDRPIIMIRFNPDKFKNKNNKYIRGLFTFDKNNSMKILNKTEYKKRLDVLKQTIKLNINNIENEQYKEIRLFFDNYV